MKFFVILLVFVGFVMLAPDAFAWCPQNEDWPDRPCYAPFQDVGIEKERSNWAQYFDFKGSEWMESKKQEMTLAIQNDTLSDWIELTSKTQAHRNVHEYYFLLGEVPNIDGEFVDESHMPLEFIEKYHFIDFSYANVVGEPIKFILEKITYSDCSSYTVEITDKGGNLIWGEGKFALCDPTDNTILVTSQIKIGYDKDNPIIINESGKYFLEITIDNIFKKNTFVVRQNPGGINIDDTNYSNEFYSPLKQFKNNIPFHEIKCNGNLLLTQKHDNSPACVKSETVFELIKRGWISDLIISVQSRDVFLDPKHGTSSYMDKVIPTLDDFRNTLNESKDIETIFFKFGEPHDDIGSGIHIYVYELNDLTEIWIGYADYILYIQHVDSDGNLLEQLLE